MLDETQSKILLEIVRDFAPTDVARVSNDTHLIDDLHYNSLAVLELSFAIEDEFSLPPFDDSLSGWIRTVGDLHKQIGMLLAAEEEA